MFTFRKTKTPVCRVIGGKLHNKIVYLQANTADKTPPAIDYTAKARESEMHCLYCKTKFTRPDTRKRHEDHSCRMRQIHEMLGKYLDMDREEVGCKEMNITDGVLQPLPNPNIREVIYIAGPAGSGKSTYLSKWLKESEQILDKDIILLSRLPEDAAFNGIDMMKVDIKTLENDPLTLEDVKDSITIFDDIDTSENPAITKHLETLRRDIMLNGRDHTNGGEDTYIIATNHQVTDYKATRDLLNECTSLTIFPMSSGTYGIKYAFQKYFGLSKQQIERLLNINTRWITLYKTFPPYCITEHNIFFLKDLK